MTTSIQHIEYMNILTLSLERTETEKRDCRQKLNDHRQVGEVVCFKQGTVPYSLLQTEHAWHFILAEKV